MILKNFLKKSKQRLVKKVILYDFSIDTDAMTYYLQLNHFWTGIHDVIAMLKINGQTLSLPYELNGNNLSITVSANQLKLIESKAALYIYINHQKMWITSFMSDSYKKEPVIMDGKYLLTKVNKHITIRNLLPEYHFSDNTVPIHDFQSSYSTISFQIDKNLTEFNHSHIELCALRNQKDILLEATVEDGFVQVNDLSRLSQGDWQIFIKSGNVLTPASISEQEMAPFHTYNHKIVPLSMKGSLYFLVCPNQFTVDSIFIEHLPGNIKINIIPKIIQREANLCFIMNDPIHDLDYYYGLYSEGQGYSADIPMADINELFSKKRFFVLQEGYEPLKCQIQISKDALSGEYTFQQAINAQIINYTFYERKDASLGLNIQKPKLRKVLWQVDDFILKGTIGEGSFDAFIDCYPYLYIENRDTFDAKYIPIGEVFEVDLKKLNLISLKSKGKNVFDIYVVMMHDQYGIIRKEKIKYKFAAYKKDNYYAYKQIDDNAFNQHHLLITTTPFSNVKIEVFTIPQNIQIPGDTSVKDPNIWLIGERYNTAQDNGIVLFHWLQNNTNIDVYYVIDEESPEYDKLKDNPNVLTFGSEKHFAVAFKAMVLLGTHDLENILPYKPARGFFHYENTYRVFLQHGVLGRKNVEYHKKYYDLPFNLFIVSSEPEKYDIVMDEFGYEEDEVVVTGLARFDKLIQDSKPDDILLMPTWRDWINTDQQFLESQYYSAYTNLINNARLLELLEAYDVYLNFYPHYRAQDYFQREVNVANERVRFIPYNTYYVQELLINHALLITDFSSVSFDFSLMNKPVIYYHFDAKRFFRKGILRPIEETFIGKIADSEEELVNLIEDRLQNHFSNYDVDISGIIKYQDASNCERIFQTIQSRLSEQ